MRSRPTFMRMQRRPCFAADKYNVASYGKAEGRCKSTQAHSDRDDGNHRETSCLPLERNLGIQEQECALGGTQKGRYMFIFD